MEKANTLHLAKQRFCGDPRISRRLFLQFGAGGLVSLATGIQPAFASPCRVGIGKSADPYAATLRAVESTGEWPSTKIFGKTVVIKPNLVLPMTSDTGVTTDHQVVRALVDLALEAEPAYVLIVEGGFGGANFSGCGYDFFNNYNSRVRLLDLNDEPLVLAKVPGGMAYHRIYTPRLLLSDDVVFISVAKLKTHKHTYATLSMKNLIGLAPIDKYSYPLVDRLGALHYRGISQVVVDLNLLRHVDFAVVDGVWGMEGDGPVAGDPVRMDMVIAGRNSVAVDSLCLWTMAVPQRAAKHLTYAARKGLGPADLDQIKVLGDPFTQRQFTRPAKLAPLTGYPCALPQRFTPGSSQEVLIIYTVGPPCLTLVEIVRTSEISPEVTPIRILQDWESRPAGFEVLKWDGRDDTGVVVSPARYTMRVQAKYDNDGTHAYATGWVSVIAP